MSSILDYNSLKDLLVQLAPRDSFIKEDSISDILQNSDIEFEYFKNCNIINGNKNNITVDTISTGFSNNNELHIKNHCKSIELSTPLYKESFLSEFKNETEKQKVRDNLEVYGKLDINKIISEIIANDSGTFITKLEVTLLLTNLDFVNSTLKALVNYDIPNNLFKI